METHKAAIIEDIVLCTWLFHKTELPALQYGVLAFKYYTTLKL